MITNEAKEEVCNKYKNYLKLIDKLGNKIMLQKHFIVLSIILNISKDKFQVMKALQDLEQYEIIKKINLDSSKNKIIIFKKFAIRFLRGFNSSQSVAAVPKVNTNRKYYLNYFKVQYILEIIIPKMKKNNLELNLKSLIDYMNELNCNILYSKNNILEYYNKNIFKYKNFLNEIEFKNDVYKLNKQHDKLIKNLGNRDGTESKYINQNKVIKKRKTKWDYLVDSNISTLLRKDVYISKIEEKDNKINISVFYIDVLNTQNSKNIILNLAICYTIFKRLFNGNIVLNFRIIPMNKIAQKNIYDDLVGNKLTNLLKSFHLNELDWQIINLKLGTLKKNTLELEQTDLLEKYRL